MLLVLIMINHPRTNEENTTIPILQMRKLTLTEVTESPKRTHNKWQRHMDTAAERTFLLHGCLQRALVPLCADFFWSRMQIGESMHKGDPEIINYCWVRLAESLGRSGCACSSLPRPASVCTSGTGSHQNSLASSFFMGMVSLGVAGSSDRRR